MKEILTDIDRWRARGERVAVARVVGLDGSGPRDPGAAMAVSERSEVTGSVSGGCVEGAVVEEALAVLSGEHPPGVVSFGYSDDQAFAVGLTCGGTIHLFVEPYDESVQALAAWRAAVAAERPVALATVIEGPHTGAKLAVEADGAQTGTLGNPDLDRVAARDALGELDSGLTATRHYGEHGEARERTVRVFVESFAPPPRMVIFGAVDFTAALAQVGKLLGYRVIVSDARPVFATPARFPMADEVVNDWPDRYLAGIGAGLGQRDVVCVLTHDAKFDVPAIVSALATDVGYIGAMGSRRTHAARIERLREAGVTDDQLARVMAPIGLDIGARTPEETAIAICAEMIALRTGDGSGGSLRDGDGPIHRTT
jgi:xanthine dehydrogenase accessory factor